MSEDEVPDILDDRLEASEVLYEAAALLEYGGISPHSDAYAAALYDMSAQLVLSMDLPQIAPSTAPEMCDHEEGTYALQGLEICPLCDSVV